MRNSSLKVLALLILPILLLSTALIVLAAEPEDFDHRNNLSRTTKFGFDSSAPQIATSGPNIAVVWSDGFNDKPTTKDAGHVYLKTAKEGSDPLNGEGYWRAKTFVFEADTNRWATNASFTFDHSNTNFVHVVWSEADSCAGALFNCRFRTIKYKRCNISGNINTCEASQTVVNTLLNESLVDPQIAHDNDGDLHVIWLRESQATNKYFYSRHDGVGWSSPTEIGVTEFGQDARLIYTNNRLHLVWDNETPNQQSKNIKYFYDSNDDDSLLSPDSQEAFLGFGVDYHPNGDAGNPDLIALDDWLVIAFDGQNTQDADQFALFYTLSTDNGDNWLNVNSLPVKITPQDFESKEADFGLKPRLAISTSGSLHDIYAVWQEEIRPTPFDSAQYRVRFSDLNLTKANPVNSDPFVWSEPVTVTFPTIKSRDTINPGLAVTRLADGSGTGNIAYQEIVNYVGGEQRFDLFYRGGIAGTIDPAYILDEFEGIDGQLENFKTVNPASVQTSTFPINVDLEYTILFTNTGNLDAVGVGFTDTLPSGVTYNNDLVHTGAGSAQYDGNRTISWFGTVKSGESVRLTFSVNTASISQVPTTVRNQLEMWNIGVTEPFLNDTADTILAASINYLPVIFR